MHTCIHIYMNVCRKWSSRQPKSSLLCWRLLVSCWRTSRSPARWQMTWMRCASRCMCVCVCTYACLKYVQNGKRHRWSPARRQMGVVRAVCVCVYVCVCVCMRAYMYNMCTYTHVKWWRTSKSPAMEWIRCGLRCFCAYMCAYVYKYVYIHTRIETVNDIKLSGMWIYDTN
jgi:hypothetical protein